LFFLPIAFSIMSLSVTTLRNKSYYLLYPFTVLFLVPSWLIEQRYYIVPFSLFILFKNEKSRLVEYSTIAMYIVTSALLFYGIQKGLFFL
jgi:alpha-1,2-glucosyltransferase